MIILILGIILICLIQWQINEALLRRTRPQGLLGSVQTDWPYRFSRRLTQVETQLALFIKDSGYKYIPEKTEETHQGDLHEVKVTPAKFERTTSVKSSRK